MAARLLLCFFLAVTAATEGVHEDSGTGRGDSDGPHAVAPVPHSPARHRQLMRRGPLEADLSRTAALRRRPSPSRTGGLAETREKATGRKAPGGPGSFWSAWPSRGSVSLAAPLAYHAAWPKPQRLERSEPPRKDAPFAEAYRTGRRPPGIWRRKVSRLSLPTRQHGPSEMEIVVPSASLESLAATAGNETPAPDPKVDAFSLVARQTPANLSAYKVPDANVPAITDTYNPDHAVAFTSPPPEKEANGSSDVESTNAAGNAGNTVSAGNKSWKSNGTSNGTEKGECNESNESSSGSSGATSACLPGGKVMDIVNDPKKKDASGGGDAITKNGKTDLSSVDAAAQAKADKEAADASGNASSVAAAQPAAAASGSASKNAGAGGAGGKPPGGKLADWLSEEGSAPNGSMVTMEVTTAGIDFVALAAQNLTTQFEEGIAEGVAKVSSRIAPKHVHVLWDMGTKAENAAALLEHVLGLSNSFTVAVIPPLGVPATELAETLENSSDLGASLLAAEKMSTPEMGAFLAGRHSASLGVSNVGIIMATHMPTPPPTSPAVAKKNGSSGNASHGLKRLERVPVLEHGKKHWKNHVKAKKIEIESDEPEAGGSGIVIILVVVLIVLTCICALAAIPLLMMGSPKGRSNEPP